MSFSLRQLRYFVATAEHGQVSHAAVDLSISQSAVTMAIKDLEQIVGVSLFNRTSHGVELTPAGRQFLSHAYEILAKVDEASHLNLVSNDVEGSLVIAATYTVMGYFLPLHIERMHRLYPKLDIQMYEINRESIEEGLLSNRYDISVLLTSNILNPMLTTETLLSSVRRLWVPAQHPLLRKSGVGLRDIAEEPYIMLTVDEAAHSSLKYWNSTLYQPKVRLRTSSIEAVRSMVANGQGVAILSDMVHRPWSLEGRRIETLNIQDPVPPMDVGLAWKANTVFTPRDAGISDILSAGLQLAWNERIATHIDIPIFKTSVVARMAEWIKARKKTMKRSGPRILTPAMPVRMAGRKRPIA